MTDFKKFKILVVDGEETLRTAIAFDFKKKGFTVFSAENGAQAFDIVKAEKVDLVLSDMRMPGGDGMSLLESIRRYNPDIPVLIFVTGFSEFSESECRSKGASGIFTKPYGRKELMSAVLNSLGVMDIAKAG
jgi:CheY-like chemotaxis protein